MKSRSFVLEGLVLVIIETSNAVVGSGLGPSRRRDIAWRYGHG